MTACAEPGCGGFSVYKGRCPDHAREREREHGRQGGQFMVGDFVIPLDAERVRSVDQTSGGRHPGLDFTIGTDNQPAVTVRVTFAEHAR